MQIPEADERAQQYPFAFSGGMLQRAMIAMAIACEPVVLIADEPTTALDVTIQAQILDLLAELQRKNGMAIVLITHDLAVVARMADDVAVMYAGEIVERGAVEDVFDQPAHPYTLGLRGALPSRSTERAGLNPIEGAPPDLFDAARRVRLLRALLACDARLRAAAPGTARPSPPATRRCCWLHAPGAPRTHPAIQHRVRA